MEDLPLSEQASKNAKPPHYWRDHRDMIISTAELEYETSFFAVQKELETIIEADSENPHFKSMFVSFSLTLATIRKVCREHGLTIKQFPGALRGHGDSTRRFYTLPICTKITHVESMQFEMVIIDIPVENKATSYGAALTFGKRYALQGYFGIAGADSDALEHISNQMEAKDAEETAEPLINAINELDTQKALDDWLKKNEAGLKMYGESVLYFVRRAFAERQATLKTKPSPKAEAAKS